MATFNYHTQPVLPDDNSVPAATYSMTGSNDGSFGLTFTFFRRHYLWDFDMAHHNNKFHYQIESRLVSKDDELSGEMDRRGEWCTRNSKIPSLRGIFTAKNPYAKGWILSFRDTTAPLGVDDYLAAAPGENAPAHDLSCCRYEKMLISAACAIVVRRWSKTRMDNLTKGSHTWHHSGDRWIKIGHVGTGVYAGGGSLAITSLTR